MARFWLAIGRWLQLLLGRWEPPPWLRFVGRQIRAGARWTRGHRGAAVAIGAVVLALAGAVGAGILYLRSRPKPVTTDVLLTPPAVTPIGEKRVPRPLVLDFERSVAPLELLRQPVRRGVELRPAFAGSWSWASDKQLVFTPKQDWPVGQEYEVRLDSELVHKRITLAREQLAFRSAPFEVKLWEAEFYQDPIDPHMKKVVATFRFSHPVEPSSFESRLALRFVPSNAEDKPFDPKFVVSYDKHKGEGYVHSHAFALPRGGASVQLSLKAGTRAARGGPAFGKALSEAVKVPGLYDFFRIAKVEPQVVDNEKLEPEQVLIVESSGSVGEQELAAATRAFVLPETNPLAPDQAARKQRHYWSNPEEISPALLKHATALPLSPIATEREFAEQHSFRFSAEPHRFVYVRIDKGVRAFGGYILGETFQAIFEVPQYPQQLKLLSSGSLLALSGSRKLSVFARDVPGVRFEIARVQPDQLHHWVSQGTGAMSTPSFTRALDPDHLAEFDVQTRAIASARGKPVYETLDLAPYLDAAAGKRGVFYLKIQSWDPATGYPGEPEDSRLILVSDLGVLAKRAADGSHSVFVQSIHSGLPVANALVQVIGRNGQPVEAGTTDGEGRASLPSLDALQRERTPVMFLVTLGRDASFLPYDRHDRTLDLSRFDVGGLHDSGQAEALSAYLFSDRGVYRPGDEIHIGIALRKRDWSSDFAGLPLQAIITDPRGMEVKKVGLKLGPAGFEELSYRPQEVAPTGIYVINLFTVKDGYADALLGSTRVQVREFLPDRLTIKARLSHESLEGWVSPRDLKASVTLSNLFGTPASGRTVRGRLRLTPGLPAFGQLRGYHFADPLRAREPVEVSLPDTQTDAEGAASFDLPLARYAGATYRLSFVAEGFEAAAGRSVMAEASTVVSPMPYLIGWKADGDLGYLARGSKRAVDLIAVGASGSRVAAGELTAVMYERRFVSTLVRQNDGRYKYESVRKEIERSRAPLAIAAKGHRFALPTDQPGDFSLVVENARDQQLQRVDFTVAGAGNLSRSLEKNAELQIALASDDVVPGAEIELQIKAPYQGSGLITIERDKIYSARWFKTQTNSTIERIKLPETLEGGGYVSVAFIRDPGSDEVFMSPLSHGVVPFSISRARRAIDLQVQSAELAKPGRPYRMKVRADRPARAVVFAVDEGILRVAGYRPPDPLAHFFQKRALTVRTSQILDLILPEYARLLQTLAPGGDSEEQKAIGANLNPFKRRRDKPVAYWSGLVDIGPQERELVYDVPDTFSGTLHVMAVAVSPDAVGAFDRQAIVRGDFTLTPNLPSFVAPGDEFEVSIGVANNVLGSGKKPEVQLQLSPPPQLQLLGDAQASLQIGEMREASASFRLRARDQLGSAALTFEARLADKRGRVSTDLSVRPASPHRTTVHSGFVRDDSLELKVPRTLYPEQRSLQASISPVPLALAHGLTSYLQSFPHACTEQVVSQAVPAIALGKQPEFGFKPGAASAAVSNMIDVLRSRQNDDGGFGLWAANPRTAPLPTVWALHALSDAKQRDYRVPAELLKAGMRYLQNLAQETPADLAAARLRSYAIYVLTRNAVATGSVSAAARKHLEANFPQQWQADLAGAYLGASFRLLKQDALAARAIGDCRLGQPHAPDYAAYHDALLHDTQLLYLLARHFPERAAELGEGEIGAVARGLGEGSYNTFSSAFAIMALHAHAEAARKTDLPAQRSIAELLDGGTRHPLALGTGLLSTSSFSDKARALLFESRGQFGSYYQMTQRGFDLPAAAPPISEKLEVVREYLDASGKPAQQVELGGELRVRLRVRGHAPAIPSLAIVDLLPGGFEVVVQSGSARPEVEPHQAEHEAEGGALGPGPQSAALPIALPGSTFMPDYGDVREDRVVLYGSATEDAVTFEYAIKATNRGRFSVAPIQAESLYDRSVRARGTGGQITVK